MLACSLVNILSFGEHGSGTTQREQCNEQIMTGDEMQSHTARLGAPREEEGHNANENCAQTAMSGWACPVMCMDRSNLRGIDE